MDRRPSSSPPPPAPADSPDRTQTLQSRESRTGHDGPDPATAATQVARGTPTWGGEARAPLAQLPIDDPDRYSLVGEHARGGLGRVLRATDTRLGRTVAVKELLKKNDVAESLFVREALITARLQHPSIVPVIEAGRWPSGEPYYVMKLVEGRSLKELIHERKTLVERLALLPHAIAIAEAIGYAHSQEVIHRDVKPANVVVGEFGETVVVDWGLARDGRKDAATPEVTDEQLSRGAPGSGNSSHGTQETVSGRVIGTPQYMAPEQARGETVDARADVYSIGALLYELLAGVAPFAGGDADTILQKVVSGPPRSLADLQPDVPRDLVAIVEKAMARAPDDRYPTAKELAEDLKRFQTGQLVTAQQYGTMQLVRRWMARNRGPVAVAAIGAVIVLLVAIGMIRRVVEERNLAREERANAERAETAAEKRANALRQLQAESSVRRDPTAAVAWLKTLAIDGSNAGASATILDEALAAGVARHVFRHDDWVYGVDFAPDGTRLTTASKDGRVRIFDLTQSPPRIAMLGVHPGGVVAALFVDEGRALVTGGNDGAVLLWPTDGGKPRALVTLDTTVKAMELLPTGVLRVGTEGEDIALIQMPAGKVILHLRRSQGLTGLVAGDMSPLDPMLWVVAYQDGRLSLLERGEPKSALPKLPRAARVISYAPDGGRVAVFDGEQLHVVDLAARSVRTIGALRGRYLFLEWSRDGRSIAAGGEVPELSIFDATVTAAAEPRVLRGHADSIYGAYWTRDGKRILTASDDGTARVWDLVTGGVEVLRGHEDDVYAAAFSPDEQAVATASLDGSARVWPVGTTGARVHGGDVGTILSIEMVDADTAITVSSPFQVIRWDLATGARTVLVPRVDETFMVPLASLSARGDVAYVVGDASDAILLVRADGTKATLTGHAGKIVGIGFGADGALYSGGWDGTVRRWDVATGESRAVVRGEQIEALGMGPSRDRVYLVHGERVGMHRLDGSVIGEVRRATLPTAHKWGRRRFSPDGQVLVIAGRDGRIVAWRPEEGTMLPLEGVGHHATNLSFSPDGKRVAGAMADRTVRIWDLQTGALVQTLHGHVDLVMNVAYSPDGQRLASTSYDRTVRIWDLATGQSRVLRGHNGPVESVVWLDGGERLMTGSRDGTLRIWPAPSTATPSAQELRSAIERSTTAVVGAGEKVATPTSR